MTRSRVNSETHEDTQRSILKNRRASIDLAAVIRAKYQWREAQKDGDEQLTLHQYEKNRQSDHHLRPHAGTVAMIERQMSKSQVPTTVIAARKEILDNRIEQLAEYLTDMAENKTVEELALEVKAAYIDMLNTEGSYKWSTFDRSSDPENNYKWTYASSFFFAMNVYTTTGYDRAGQWFVIIYGFIFVVPVTLVVVRDLGQWLLLVITRFYAKMLLKYRFHRFLYGVCLLFGRVFGTLLAPGNFFVDWFHSLYFSYMSFTTIGLGDVMPNNATFAPIVSILFFLGLPIMKVVNRMTYLTVENGAFGLLTVMENRIDNYWEQKQSPRTGVRPKLLHPKKDLKAKEWIRTMKRYPLMVNNIARCALKANRDVTVAASARLTYELSTCCRRMSRTLFAPEDQIVNCFSVTIGTSI
ncbi:Ion channel [Ostertagia ostertagi]